MGLDAKITKGGGDARTALIVGAGTTIGYALSTTNPLLGMAAGALISYGADRLLARNYYK